MCVLVVSAKGGPDESTSISDNRLSFLKAEVTDKVACHVLVILQKNRNECEKKLELKRKQNIGFLFCNTITLK